MNCTEAQQQCHPYLDQQLESSQRQYVDQHLAACPPCAKLYDAQRSFLGTLKKLVHGSDVSAAPEAFRARIRASLAEVPAKPVAETPRLAPAPRPSWRMGPLMATAATIMLAFSGLLISQMLCLTGECPIAMAAEREHQRILAGAQPVLARDVDPDHLKQALREHMADFPGLPSLCNCHLNPLNCGLVKIDGLPEGAFVQYAECKHEDDPVTLMIVNTSAMSKAEVLKVRQKEFHFAMRSDNSVVSWRNDKDGMLYILVARRPMEESIKIAELASR